MREKQGLKVTKRTIPVAEERKRSHVGMTSAGGGSRCGKEIVIAARPHVK